MKEGWTYKKLGEVGSFIRGGGFLKRDFVENGIPCIHYGQIHTILGSVTKEHLTSIPEALRTKTRFASKGDVIFAITSEDVEGSCKCTAWMGDYDVAVGGHAAIYKHSLNPVYVSLFAKSPVFNKAKEEFVHGFKVMEIKPADIAKIEIPVPPLSEQQRIVSRLDAAFSHIDELKANAEKQLSEARALFQKSLDKALCNKRWRQYTLNELCIQITDGTHKTPHYTDKGVPFLSVKNVTSGYIDMNNTRYISEDEHRELIKRCKPEFGDILYTKVGTTGVAKVIDVKKEFSIFVSLALLKIKKELVSNKFLEYVLNSPYVYKQSQKLTSGAANRNYLLNDIKKVELYIPHLSEQQRIVERLDALSAHVRELEENQKKIISECDALKQALLRKVFE